MNILVIPDAHSSPDTDQRRFKWLGEFILDRDPDIVVNIGDWADMNSLCSYDRGKKAFEGRRYRTDIDAAIEAHILTWGPLTKYNNQRKNIKKSQRRIPRKIITLGNHEFRINRAVENSPEMEGIISVKDLKFEEFGYEVYKFKQPICVEGVWFCHYYPSGVKGESISGFNIASNLLAKNSVSSVCGHSHLFDHATRARPDGTKLIGLNVGCYLEDVTYEDATQTLWWAGLIELIDVHDGVFDVCQWSLERIRSNYS
jgi:hypothetical protein